MTRLIELAAITAIMFVMAWMFIDGLDRELELREEHARIHWRSR